MKGKGKPAKAMKKPKMTAIKVVKGVKVNPFKGKKGY